MFEKEKQGLEREKQGHMAHLLLNLVLEMGFLWGMASIHLEKKIKI